ncbi:hypothetical protein EOI86_05185 [Hwanghaeella grinnelliae]|uniref:Glycerophosphoryl diester phosphodiesterase membrane domain-containing protein n=1 Tax=Hwanghaeella grinnelliae TaxID=2500179 RepID=A0A437QVX5_9PROT|nr:hypothetical protein [Hwanghaeella grinnelliae]RVU38672.1 hypothetical protein EOI86_05185 [Hwanghaeella grinnelliae]
MSDQNGGIPSGTSDSGAAGVSAPAMAPGTLSIGTVFSVTLSILFTNFHRFFLLAAVTWLPTLAVILIAPSFQADMMTGAASPVFIAAYVIVSWLLVSWLYGAITHMACVLLANGDVSIVASMVEGLKRGIPVFFVMVLQGLAMMVGFVFLVIPGVIVMTMLFIAVPAAVAERKGPFAALSRSAALTKGYRWRIFGAGILAFLLMLAVGVAFGIAAGTFPFTLSGELIQTAPGTAAIVIGSLFEAVQYLFILVFASVLYHQIRVAKEGSSAEEIASVFD